MKIDVLAGRKAAAIAGSNGDTYHVTVDVLDGCPLFTCDHPHVLGFGRPSRSTIAGHCACKHARRVAEQLAKVGWLEPYAGDGKDTLWQLTPAATAAIEARAALVPDVDPFDGI